MERYTMVNGLGVKMGEVVKTKNGWTITNKNGRTYRTVATLFFAKNLVNSLGYVLQ